MNMPDYNDLFDRYENEREKELARLPKCYECDEPIIDEDCYEFDNRLICPDCLKDNHKKYTNEFIEEY